MLTSQASCSDDKLNRLYDALRILASDDDALTVINNAIEQCLAAQGSLSGINVAGFNKLTIN